MASAVWIGVAKLGTAPPLLVFGDPDRPGRNKIHRTLGRQSQKLVQPRWAVGGRRSISAPGGVSACRGRRRSLWPAGVTPDPAGITVRYRGACTSRRRPHLAPLSSPLHRAADIIDLIGRGA